jgi:uncharacterized protein YoxC
VIERYSLASRLAPVVAGVEKLRAVSTFAEEAAERARTAAAAIEATARDAAQATACEKATLEVKVLELERDLGTATADLAKVGRQFSQISNQLQKISEEATRLCESNAKLSEDLEGKSSGRIPSPPSSLSASHHALTCQLLFLGRASIASG